jgi:hypothetical protein
MSYRRRQQARQWAAGIALALAFCHVVADARPLSANAVDETRRAFQGAPGGFSFDDAHAVGADRMAGSFCLPGGAQPRSCFSVELSDPSASCAGQAVNDFWCVRFLTEPPPATRNQLMHAISAACPVGLWTGGASGSRLSRAQEPVWRQDLAALALGVVLLILPWLLGLLLGRLARRPIGLRRWVERWGFAGPVVLLVVAVLLIPKLPFVSAWDVLFLALLAGAGFVLGTRAWPLRQLAILHVVLALVAVASFGVLELFSRLALAPAPGATFSAHEAHFLLGHEVRDYDCTLLYPEGEPIPQMQPCGKPASQRVLHIGDSMVWGAGVQPQQTFTAELERLQPNVVHVNAGVSNTGPDYQYLLLKQRLERTVVDLAVVYFYTENDVQDMDRPFSCCDEGPLLTYSAEGASQKCGVADWRFSLRQLLGRSPPPYSLRVGAGVSRLAARLNVAFNQFVWRSFMLGDRTAPTSESAWSHIELSLKAMRDETRKHGVPLVVVVLPYRAALVAAHPEQDDAALVRDRVLQVLAKLDIPALDAWPLLADALKRDPNQLRWFATPPPNDGHFSPEGHKLMADWLEPRLAPYLARPLPTP